MIGISRTRRTIRSAAAEFGPPPGAQYPELADYTDGELMSRSTAEILAEIRADRAAHRPKEMAR